MLIWETLNLSTDADSSTNTKTDYNKHKIKKVNKLWVMCRVSYFTFYLSCVMCHVRRVTCNMSPVTKANSHSHRPSHIIHNMLVHSNLVNSRLAWKTPKSWKTQEKTSKKVKKKKWRYTNNSDTPFDQRSLVHWVVSFPGCEIHTHTQTDIATTRLNRSRGRFSDNLCSPMTKRLQKDLNKYRKYNFKLLLKIPKNFIQSHKKSIIKVDKIMASNG